MAMTTDRFDADRVVLAWEPAGPVTLEDRLAAVDVIARQLGQVASAFVLPWGRAEAAAMDRVVAMAMHHRIPVLPLVEVDRGSSHWACEALPASQRVLADAGVLCEFKGERYALCRADTGGRAEEDVPTIRRALAAPGGRTRVGWLRRVSPYVAIPSVFDFALDWPPFGVDAPNAGGEVRREDHGSITLDIAKRHGANAMLAPSVLWSPTGDAHLSDGATRVDGISPLRIAYAIDAARRQVRNRIHANVPFWALRLAFSPQDERQAESLDALATTLESPHRPSIAFPGVTGIPDRITPRARIAVVVHLYYPELWDELAAAIACISEPVDLFVSCPYRVLAAVQDMVGQRFAEASVYGVQNLGRDVLPFMAWLRAVEAPGYAYVLKIHGKKSIHIVDLEVGPFGSGDDWRRGALAGLIGDEAHVRQLLAALDASPQVGLVAAAGHLYDQVRWRCGTGDLVETALRRLGLERKVEGAFPAGTMFWARGAVLAPLARVPDTMLDFEREVGQVDETLHHAYERLYALVAEGLGFRVTDSRTLLSRAAAASI